MGSLLNTASQLICPHGGSVSIVTSNARTKAGGDFAVRSGDTFTISGCAFSIGPTPHPCVRVQWIVPAQRCKVLADSVLTDASVGLCLAADSAPQGAVSVSSTQTQVKGQ